ncbi:MAG: hypothetical protein M3Y91_08870 [Actinomycetota bacterium]|nr:hypothetical protein [Actinomycetota bacterium]
MVGMVTQATESDEVAGPEPAEPDPEGCYGCYRTTGYRRRHPYYFTDSRTGRSFCHECIAVLVTWELDGCPEADELDYPDWLGDAWPEIKEGADQLAADIAAVSSKARPPTRCHR